MQYRSIPGIPKPVSVLSIGSWRTFEKMEFEDIVAVLEAGFNAGINFFDDCRYGTAPGVPMGIPTTEVIFGRALKTIGKPRNTYFLANKMWWDQYPKKSLREQLLAALKRIDDEYVDLLYFDRPDKLEGAHPGYKFDYDDLVCTIASEAKAMMKEGLIKAYGFANSRPDAMERITKITDKNGLPGPAVAQIRYSMVDPEASTAPELKALHKSHGMMLTATTTIAGGILSGKYLADGNEPRRLSPEKLAENTKALELSQKLSKLASEVGLPPSALAMSFPLLDPAVASVVFGARSVAQVKENLRALDAANTDTGKKLMALMA